MMTRYKVGFIIWGIFCFIDSLVFISMLFTKEPSAIISNAIPFGITVFGTAFNVIKYVRTKKPKSNDTPQQTTTPAIPTTAGAQELFRENQDYILNPRNGNHVNPLANSNNIQTMPTFSQEPTNNTVLNATPSQQATQSPISRFTTNSVTNIPQNNFIGNTTAASPTNANPRNISSLRQNAEDVQHNTQSVPSVTQQTQSVTTSTQQEQPTVYIRSGNSVSRADGKPISNEEVPYLIEMGYRHALEREQSRPKLSARDEELEFQFMQNHGAESQKRCDKFENLNRLAFKEDDIDKKIILLQQTIDAFESAKRWHYNCSKGGKIYFQEFWEQFYNSENSCYSWIDSVKDNLEFQIYKRDNIIPWILENAKIGFIQTSIYKEFPEDEKGDLRKTIDELANQQKVIKSRKGSTYFITLFQQ